MLNYHNIIQVGDTLYQTLKMLVLQAQEGHGKLRVVIYKKMGDTTDNGLVAMELCVHYHEYSAGRFTQSLYLPYSVSEKLYEKYFRRPGDVKSWKMEVLPESGQQHEGIILDVINIIHNSEN